MHTSKLLTASILSAILAIGAIASIGSVATNSVFAQVGDDDDDGRDDDSSQTTSSGTTAAGNATTLSGTIASLQANDAGAPAWITSGHWKLESDSSVTDDDDTTEPRISNFNAVIYMTSLTNGSNIHQHEISDFRQTSILHPSQNVTTINGTLTISMSDGPHQNTSGYIRLQNNMISIWVDPTEIDEHFGPTPVYGIVLPDRFKIDDDDWDDDENTAMQGLGDDDGRDDAGGASTQGNLGDDDADDREAGGGASVPGTSGDNDDDDGDDD